MKQTSSITRRHFLKGAATATSAMALPMIVPGTVFGANAPSNRIVMGAIGVGSMGTGDLQGFLGKREVQMVAVCDVEQKHRDNAKNITDKRYDNQNCKSYLDYRDVIARADLDAVMLALPDHLLVKLLLSVLAVFFAFRLIRYHHHYL